MINILVEYARNNELSLDIGTYLTVVIGQLTVYVILMGFYQLVSTFQGTNKGDKQSYLGVNLTDYYVKKKMRFYNNIIFNPLFCGSMIAHILYKPVIVVYGSIISDEVLRICNFFWYSFFVLFSCLFLSAFFKCTKCVFDLKDAININKNGEIIEGIDEDLKRKNAKVSKKNQRIDVLAKNMWSLLRRIEEENDKEWMGKYNKLVQELFDEYTENKRK